jgi:PAS domain S-box-containing protein
VGLALAAFVLRSVVGDHLGGDPLLVLALPVVVLSAWRGGLWPGMLGATLILIGRVAWVPQHGGLPIGESFWLRAAFSVPSALMVCAAFEQVHRARRAAESQAAHARHDVDEAWRTVEAERSAQQRMQRLIDSAAVAIAFSSRGVITQANDAFLVLFGYSRDELAAGRIGAHTLVPESERGVYAMAKQELDETGRNGPFHARLTRHDGLIIDVITSAGRLGDDDYCIFFTDITPLTRAEQALRASEERFRSLVNATASIVWTAGPQREFVVAQPSWEEYTGQTFDEYRGWGWLDAVHPDDRAATAEAWRETCASVRPFRGRARLWSATTRSYRRVASRANPIVRDGRLVEWVGMMFDVEEGELISERLQEASERLQLLVENTPLAVIEFDGELRIARWAGQAQALFGWPAEEALGRSVAELGWALLDDPAASQAFGQLLHGPQTRASLRLQCRRRDGSTMHGEWSVSAIRNAGHVMAWSGDGPAAPAGTAAWGDAPAASPHEPGTVALLALVLDATEREAALESLRQADREKDNFIATLAHELRNPLAPIANSARLLARKPDDPVVVTRAVQAVERQVRQLGRLLDDLLDVSRISRHRLQVQRRRMHLREAVELGAEQVRPFYEATGHALALELPPQPIDVMGDLARLAQVVANLLHNAAKYTPQPARIALRVRRQGDDAVVEVEDPGVGIAPEEQQRVFEMFSQAHPELRGANPGLGIGLALVKGIVEIHGGQVRVASAGPGQGSCFTVTLPALPADPQAAVADTAPLPEADPLARLHGYRMLVVDDNVDSAESIAALLDASGNAVRTAYGAQAALEIGEGFHPNVVLMDLGMPGIDGFQAAAMMRGTAWGRAAVLIAMTGYGQPEDKRRSAQAGFDHHLTKPVDVGLLARAVAGC